MVVGVPVAVAVAEAEARVIGATAAMKLPKVGKEKSLQTR
jgi:hypothetical protein